METPTLTDLKNRLTSLYIDRIRPAIGELLELKEVEERKAEYEEGVNIINEFLENVLTSSKKAIKDEAELTDTKTFNNLKEAVEVTEWLIWLEEMEISEKLKKLTEEIKEQETELELQYFRKLAARLKTAEVQDETKKSITDKPESGPTDFSPSENSQIGYLIAKYLEDNNLEPASIGLDYETIFKFYQPTMGYPLFTIYQSQDQKADTSL